MINIKDFLLKYNIVCATEEQLMNDFNAWFDEKSRDFNFCADILIKYMAENHSPHSCCIVGNDYAEIVEGVKCHKNEKYVKD
jgi:hypothetical protein